MKKNMRIPRNLIRKIGDREPKSKYYIIAEGDRTEFKYFCGIRNNASELKIDALIEIIPLQNEDKEKGQSHPIRKIKNFNETIKNGGIIFDAAIDRVYFVFDRDPQNFSDSQFDEVKKYVKEQTGYEMCISNPTFELFLLMHTDEILTLDKDKMLLNERQGTKRGKRFLEKEVSRIFGCNKSNLNFEKFKTNIRKAIQNEKYFCEDLEKLKKDLGSNVGVFLDSIISQ